MRIFSSRLNFVKPHEPEQTFGAASGLNQAMPRLPSEITGYDGIARRLRATRAALQLSQTDFCKRVGVKTNTYNQWEQAKGRPGLNYAMQLCDEIEITLDWIYRGSVLGLPHELVMKLTISEAAHVRPRGHRRA